MRSATTSRSCSSTRRRRSRKLSTGACWPRRRRTASGRPSNRMASPALDTLGMFDATAALPEQVEAAALDSARVAGLPAREAVENVVVLGMGGSGIAGDLVLAVAAPFMAIPVVVLKSYTVPAFVGEGSLVFAISFSGDTEETVEAATEAAVQGAKIVAISQGGELTRLAKAWGSPVVSVPDDIPAPRAGVGALAIPPLIVLEDIGLF